jgi:hypothetical protein
MKRTLPVVCSGYCLTNPIYTDDGASVQFSYCTDDIAKSQGWTISTNRKFNMDGKTIIWLCPDCTKRWTEERRLRIDEIMEMTLKDISERQFWNLVYELQSLNATKEEKDKFSSLLFPVRK